MRFHAITPLLFAEAATSFSLYADTMLIFSLMLSLILSRADSYMLRLLLCRLMPARYFLITFFAANAFFICQLAVTPVYIADAAFASHAATPAPRLLAAMPAVWIRHTTLSRHVDLRRQRYCRHFDTLMPPILYLLPRCHMFAPQR